MCGSCTASRSIQQTIERWADDGITFTSLEVMARPQTSYPNTYVYRLKNAVQIAGVTRDVCVDIHYTGNAITPGAPLQAIGGLWIEGVPGQAMKPTQHGGVLLSSLRSELPGSAPMTVSGTYRGGALPTGVELSTLSTF